MPYILKVERIRLLAAGALLLAIAAVITVAFVSRSDPETPETFGPWYPLVTDDGDPAVAYFGNHVPCTIDEPTRRPTASA